jgi:alpha-L-rhamnosidase-like protein
VLQRDLLGVTVTQPGAAAIDIQPPNGGVDAATGTAPTQRGPVAVSWRRGTQFDLAVTVPANVFATVHVPTTRVDHVFERGTPAGAADGVLAARAVRGDVVLTVGSGRYVFHVGAPPHEHDDRRGWFVAAAVTLVFVLVLALVFVGAIRYRRAARAPTSSSP